MQLQKAGQALAHENTQRVLLVCASLQQLLMRRKKPVVRKGKGRDERGEIQLWLPACESWLMNMHNAPRTFDAGMLR